MMVQHLKRRPLSRYLKDFKHSQTHCAHCRKLLDRITLVRDGKIVNKIEISRLDMLLDENGWQVEQNHGRHCADSAVIYIAKRRVIFSILSALSNFFLSKLK
ncbi:FliZ protein [Escherichia coli]|uniref:FliZ protein n=1 Tax=Escherichia coli TaxID=562 RepID=A0A377BMV0_ECOLX|nr:FliZ protein [Escherichia coli]